MDKKNQVEIEFLRAFAIIAVLLIHTSAYFTKSNIINTTIKGMAFVDALSHFAVPLFIFITGYLLSYWIKDKSLEFKFGLSKISKLLPSFLIASIFYLGLSHIFYPNEPQFKSFSELAFKLFSAQGGYHLWYFMLLFQFYLAFPFIYKVTQKWLQKGEKMIFIWFAIQMIWLVLGPFIESHIPETNYLFRYLKVLIHNFLLSHIFYFALGIYSGIYSKAKNIKLYFLEPKRYAWIIIYIIICGYLVSKYWIFLTIKFGGFGKIPNIYLIPGELCLAITFPITIVLLVALSKKILADNLIGKLLVRIGNLSYGIYLIHAGILYVVAAFIPKFGISYSNPFFYISAFFITLLTSYATVAVISYLPFSDFLLGKTKQSFNLSAKNKYEYGNES